MSDERIEISLGGNAAVQPQEDNIARRGPRRMVKLIPLPGNYAAPAIWTSPYTIEDDTHTPCRLVIVLVAKAPKPETMRMTVPQDFLEKLPEVPVEW